MGTGVGNIKWIKTRAEAKIQITERKGERVSLSEEKEKNKKPKTVFGFASYIGINQRAVSLKTDILLCFGFTFCRYHLFWVLLVSAYILLFLIFDFMGWACGSVCLCVCFLCVCVCVLKLWFVPVQISSTPYASSFKWGYFYRLSKCALPLS